MSRLERLVENFGVTLKHMAEQSYKPLTNGDIIRSMSDEELAKIISDGGCPPKISDIVCETTDDCNVCWRNWLKQPVEVE